MLCPEVYNFKAPESHFQIKKSASNEVFLNTIKTFSFPHVVSVIIPDILKFPENLTRSLTSSSQYFKITDFSIGELLNKNFINCFIKRGSLNLLTVNSRLDCDNCVSVTPEGYLFLNLDKQSYQSLGLEGKVSHFHSKSKDRFIVTVNLKSDAFKPGKSSFERTKACLNRLGRFKVILKWEPPETNPGVCPSSIAKYFSDLDYDVYYSDLSFKSNTLYSLKVPLLQLETCSQEEIVSFSEWLGTVSVEANINGSSEDYLSTYEVPEPNCILGQVKVLQWRGLFSERQLKGFIDCLKNFVEVEQKEWLSLYVQGFSDSVVAWGNEEHHYYTNGDNSYLCIVNKDVYVTCINRCSKKQYK